MITPAIRVSRCTVARYDKSMRGRWAFMGDEIMILCNSCSVALPEGIHGTRLKVRSRKPPTRGLTCVMCSAVGTYEKEPR